jgi:hypothetical protein
VKEGEGGFQDFGKIYFWEVCGNKSVVPGMKVACEKKVKCTDSGNFGD